MGSRNRLVRAAATVAVLVASIGVTEAATSPAAGAWTLDQCGRFTGSSPAIGYKFHSVNSTNQTVFHDAQYRWDLSSAPGYFWHDTGTDPEIDVYDSWYSGGWWAWTQNPCPSSPNPALYNNNELDIKIDIGDTAGLTTAERRMVIVHELGHAYGLGHSSLGCGTNQAVMRQGSAKFSCLGIPPWANDVSGVHAAY